MSSPQPGGAPPRMLHWLLATVALMVLAQWAMRVDAGALYAVSLYKCHLMSLGGWGGYWLDRALFPYARPHTYVADESKPIELAPVDTDEPLDCVQGGLAAGAAHDYPLAMLRRAIIVAACLVCVGLGA